MNTNENVLSDLLTGVQETDARIQAAYRRGIRQGQREPVPENTAKAVNRLIRAFGCTAETALIVLEIPRAARKPVLKILQKQQRQKAQAE